MCYTQKFQQMSSGKLFGRLKGKLFYSFTYCMCYQQLQCATVRCDTKTTCRRVTARLEKGFAPGFSLCQNLRILAPQISRVPWQTRDGRVMVGVLRALTGLRWFRCRPQLQLTILTLSEELSGIISAKSKMVESNFQVVFFCIVIISSHILGEELGGSCSTLEFEGSHLMAPRGHAPGRLSHARLFTHRFTQQEAQPCLLHFPQGLLPSSCSTG